MKRLFGYSKGIILPGTLRDAGIQFVGNAGASLLGIVFTIVVARNLGPENWGIIASAIAFIGIVSSVFDLGLTSTLFRYISKYWKIEPRKAKSKVNQIFTLRFIVASLALLIFTIFSINISRIFLKSENWILAAAVGVGVFGGLLLDFQITIFQSRREWVKSASFLIFWNLIRVVAIVAILSFGSLSVLSTLLIFSFSAVVSFLFSFTLHPSHLVSVAFKDVKKMAGFSGWMGINRIVSSIFGRVDTLLLLQIAGSYQTGIFAAAKQLAMGVPLFVGSFATVLAPKLASYEDKNLKEFLKKSIYLTLFLSAGIMVGIFASPLVISFFGEKYSQSLLVLQLLLASYIPFSLATPFTNYLIYSLGKPKLITFVSVFQVLITIVGNIYLIPVIGVFSPVIILFVSNFLLLAATAGGTVYYLRK